MRRSDGSALSMKNLREPMTMVLKITNEVGQPWPPVDLPGMNRNELPTRNSTEVHCKSGFNMKLKCNSSNSQFESWSLSSILFNLFFNSLRLFSECGAQENVTCAYWDEEEHRWSAEGVTTKGTSNGELRCETTHLSVFAGVPCP